MLEVGNFFVQDLAISLNAFVHRAFRQAHTHCSLQMRRGRNICARDSDRAIPIGGKRCRAWNFAMWEVTGYRYGCRNSMSSGSDRNRWRSLAGAVDHELELTTSTAEAFDIAVKLNPSIFDAEIRSAVVHCEVRNIRIIRKIIRTVNRLLIGKTDLTAGTLARTIPSTALLTAAHYQGIAGGPTTV